MITLTPVFVLHTRPFKNSSLLVELFSEIHGRLSVVANNARGPKSRFQGQLQLFTPMMASWYGRHELKTLQQSELSGLAFTLNHTALFSGFYLNELLMKLLQKEDPHSDVFALYENTLRMLSAGAPVESTLRRFEKRLLSHLGFGIPFSHEAKSGRPINTICHYDFLPTQGFVLSQDHTAFLGAHLQLIAAEVFDTPAVLHAAKLLMRQALQALLGAYLLKSRALF